MPKPKTKRFWVIVHDKGTILYRTAGARRAMAWGHMASSPEGITYLKSLGFRAVRARLEVS